MIYEEDGKTFYRTGYTYTRIHDDKYDGKKTEYYRCENCGKLIHCSWQSKHRGIKYNEYNCKKNETKD